LGYYIEVPNRFNKAEQLVKIHKARILNHTPDWNEAKPDEAIICVVDNRAFEAAAFCYSPRELDEFKADMIGTQRPRKWLIMDRKLACQLTGYKED
jgi:hypothetical protein